MGGVWLSGAFKKETGRPDHKDARLKQGAQEKGWGRSPYDATACLFAFALSHWLAMVLIALSKAD